jgi:GT2 family glycosyltransferase
MTEPLVIAIVLNWDRCDDTLECLKSLTESTYGNLQTIVLDCGSSGDSVARIRVAFPNVGVVEIVENHGYAGNNNVGIRMALQRGADWIFVLNDDTVVARDCVAELVKAGESDSRVGVVGPMVYHHDEPQIIQSAGGVLGPCWESLHLGMNERDRSFGEEPRAVEWVSGCGMLVRRDLIEEVGLLDERFFAYWEEVEWCLRAGKVGWRILHAPQARLWHKGVQRNYRPAPTVTYYSTRNRLLTLAKHHAPLRVWIGACLQIARTVTSSAIRPKSGSTGSHRQAICRGVKDFILGRWGGPVEL